jgi:ATP-binding cassette subfamily C protein
MGQMSAQPENSSRSELATALGTCRHAFIGIGLFSGMINILMLTGSFFMLQIYDRVLPSRSVPTLVALSILAGTLYVFQGVLDVVRGRILVWIGMSVDESLSSRVFETTIRLPLKAGHHAGGLQGIRDLDNIRSFLSGLGPTALFDLPWIPLYLGICFAFHFWIGVTAVIGAIVLSAITLLTEAFTRDPIKAATSYSMIRTDLAESSRRNAEVLIAMGMASSLQARWQEINRKYMASQRRASDVSGGLGAVAKILRMVLQSAVLGTGAYLVIYQQATAGIIIAGSILAARALAPVDLAIANWRGFVAARQSWARLTKQLALLPAQDDPMPLPCPANDITLKQVSIAAPGQQKLLVQDVSFCVERGRGLGIIGPTGAGKSCLARALVGVWEPARGKVCLDGATLSQWNTDALGRHVGYLPQSVELFAGTVAQNISRFHHKAHPNAIIAAARAAGVHEMILELEEGYETQIGEQGVVLSAGQQQRIALARALYGDPFLVVLDEPNSNLDSDGEEALIQAIASVRSRGGIAVVVAHRPSVLAALDLVLVMGHGRIQAFGPKDEVLSKVLRYPPLAPASYSILASGAGSAR